MSGRVHADNEGKMAEFDLAHLGAALSKEGIRLIDEDQQALPAALRPVKHLVQLRDRAAACKP